MNECVDKPPSLSSANERSPSPAEEVRTAVECPSDLLSVNELSASPAKEVPQTPSSLTCSKFYSKKRDICFVQEVKTGTYVTKTNCRRSQRSICKPSRYQ